MRWLLPALCFASAMARAQNAPVIEAGVPTVRFCDQNGTKSVRVHIFFTAVNRGPGAAVVPRFVRAERVWIADVSKRAEAGRKHRIHFGGEPSLAPEAYLEFENRGGVVVELKTGEKAKVYGLYLPLLVARNAFRRQVQPQFILETGKQYRISATMRLWTAKQYAKWIGSGYLTRRDAVVLVEINVPNEPQWRPCADEPPIVTTRRE